MQFQRLWKHLPISYDPQILLKVKKEAIASDWRTDSSSIISFDNLDVNENVNPKDDFELFMNRFTTLKQQCIPKKTVRYNKKVYKDNP